MNKTKICFCSVIWLVFMWAVPTYAQTPAFWDSLRTDSAVEMSTESKTYKPSPYCVNVQLEKFLDSVADQKRKATLIDGFRILLYSGNDREKASKAKEMAYRLIRNSDVYTSYLSPTFKVRLGDFYQKTNAFLALKKLSSAFPNAVIIQEIVHLKP